MTTLNDQTDPCVLAAALSKAYYALLTGTQAERVRFYDRDVTYRMADIDRLKAEMERQQALCAEKSGQTPRRRFAITAGTRR
jgi:hypothetical protein